MLAHDTGFLSATTAFGKKVVAAWLIAKRGVNTLILVHRRLESLPQTAGRFLLNVELLIPFDGRGRMEIDLLDADSRRAIGLDGAQHLADSSAYRRDRRKDRLLQENGYFVLRFLAEDIGCNLDEVLDTILRVLVNRQ